MGRTETSSCLGNMQCCCGALYSMIMEKDWLSGTFCIPWSEGHGLLLYAAYLSLITILKMWNVLIPGCWREECWTAVNRLKKWTSSLEIQDFVSANCCPIRSLGSMLFSSGRLLQLGILVPSRCPRWQNLKGHLICDPSVQKWTWRAVQMGAFTNNTLTHRCIISTTVYIIPTTVEGIPLGQ